MTKSVEALYRDYLDRAEGDPEEADYLALHQGRLGTQMRHQYALATENVHGRSLLDIACGTGLLLDSAASLGQHPKLYVGTDLLAEREPHVLARLEKYAVPGAFTFTPPGVRLEDVVQGQFDVAMAIGLAGFEGFATEDEIGALIETMRKYAPVGIVTVPGNMPGRGQETDYCRCHDARGLAHSLRDLGVRYVDWGWDFILRW